MCERKALFIKVLLDRADLAAGGGLTNPVSTPADPGMHSSFKTSNAYVSQSFAWPSKCRHSFISKFLAQFYYDLNTCTKTADVEFNACSAMQRVVDPFTRVIASFTAVLEIQQCVYYWS